MGNEVKVEMFKCLDQYLCVVDFCVQQVMVSLFGGVDIVLIVCSDGVLVVDIWLLVCLNVQVIVEQYGWCEFGYVGGGGCYSYVDLFVDGCLEVFVCEVLCQVLVNLEVIFVLVGVMIVVFGLGWFGVLLYEVVGYGLEGDFNCKGISVYVGCVGECVVVLGVIIVDDGILDGCCGLLNIDDEGYLIQCIMLIEDGIFVGYMQDLFNVCLMGVVLIGNGCCELFVYMIMLCMINIYMCVGQYDLEEMIWFVRKGLYVVNFGGGQVDIISGKYVFLVIEVYLIEDGWIIVLVKGVILIGNGLEMMQKVCMIGNDLVLDEGVGICGKDGQSVLVGVGQLLLLIDGIIVGGIQV